MALKVFLSFGGAPEEQVLAWRLQTLATAHGVDVFVPHRNGQSGLVGVGRVGQSKPQRGLAGLGRVLSEDTRRKIDRADFVLAVITESVSPAAEAELSYAQSKGKLVIPIVQYGTPVPRSLSQLARFEFSPWDPGKVESDVIQFLREKQVSKQNQQALGALIAIGLGLFLLSNLAEK
jgi:nucleoside 2-deoxyribosyltransferase